MKDIIADLKDAAKVIMIYNGQKMISFRLTICRTEKYQKQFNYNLCHSSKGLKSALQLPEIANDEDALNQVNEAINEYQSILDLLNPMNLPAVRICRCF